MIPRIGCSSPVHRRQSLLPVTVKDRPFTRPIGADSVDVLWILMAAKFGGQIDDRAM